MRLPIRWRRALSRPLEAIPVTIRGGPNKGAKWCLPVSGRFAAGDFEAEKFEALAALLAPGDVFWDVGAHYGYATLLGAKMVGDSGSVWSFEPSPLNRAYLERHVAWNDCGNTTILPFALADEDGVEAFGGSGSSMALGLGRGGDPVEVRTVGTMLVEGTPPPTVMKIDVEGAETRTLRGAVATDVRPAMLCSVHDTELMEACARILIEADYDVLASSPIRAYLDGSARFHGDPDLLALPAGADGLRSRIDSTALFAGAEPLRVSDLSR